MLYALVSCCHKLKKININVKKKKNSRLLLPIFETMTYSLLIGVIHLLIFFDYVAIMTWDKMKMFSISLEMQIIEGITERCVFVDVWTGTHITFSIAILILIVWLCFKTNTNVGANGFWLMWNANVVVVTGVTWVDITQLQTCCR